MYTYHDFFGTFIILNIRAVQSIQKQYGPPCRSTLVSCLGFYKNRVVLKIDAYKKRV